MLRGVASFLVIGLFVVACGGGGPAATSGPGGGQETEKPATTTTSGDEVEPTPGTSLSACEIVAPADIEAALSLDAGTVTAGELKEAGTVLDKAVTECRYQGDWGGLVVSLTPTDGINTFDALVSAFGEDAEEVSVADGGLWFEENDRGYFLKGPVMVRLQFTHLTDGTKFRDPTIAIGTAALAKV